MGINERKEREKKRRRNEILDAAERVFFEKGTHNATMDDVAEAAELSKGTLYLYFKSRDEVYLALSLRGLEIMTEMFEKAVHEAANGLERVHAIGMAYHAFTQKHPGYHEALIFWESKEHDVLNPDSEASGCAEQGDKSMGLLIEAIQLGQQDGSIRKDLDPVKTALMLWGSSMGMVQLLTTKGYHLEKDHGMDLSDMMEYTFGIIKAALMPHPEI